MTQAQAPATAEPQQQKKRRKGLSFDEKRQALLQFLHQTKDVYLLKELERIGPKRLHVVSQSVKEVMDSLVADGLCQQDRIGTSNWYWSFPSQYTNHLKQSVLAVQDQLSSVSEQTVNLQQRIKQANKARKGSSEPKQQVCELSAQLEQIEASLSKLAKTDPEIFEAKSKCADLAARACERWEENLVEIRSYCLDKFPAVSPEDFDAEFGCSEEQLSRF